MCATVSWAPSGHIRAVAVRQKHELLGEVIDARRWLALVHPWSSVVNWNLWSE